MSEQNPQQPLDDVEIEPLSDETLHRVAGGSSNSCCSCNQCSVKVGEDFVP